MKNTTFGFYNENSARNAPYLTVNGVTFYFSYSTLVGVDYGDGFYVAENRWGTTTGKHLNWIDAKDHTSRLGRAEFEKKVEIAMMEAGIAELPTINIH